MKYGKVHDCGHCYPLIDLLSTHCIDELNKIFGTHHTKDEVRAKIRVIRREQEPEFYKRLMETKPGFSKGEDV